MIPSSKKPNLEVVVESRCFCCFWLPRLSPKKKSETEEKIEEVFENAIKKQEQITASDLYRITHEPF